MTLAPRDASAAGKYAHYEGIVRASGGELRPGGRHVVAVPGVDSRGNVHGTTSLRGLAARAPYFHGGIAADLAAVVHHYETELGFDFTPSEEADLVAFLKAL